MREGHGDNQSLADDIAETIRADRTHGASQLARLALALLAEFTRHAPQRSLTRIDTDLVQLAQRLQQVRPSMAAVANLIGRWLSAIRSASYESADALCALVEKNTEELIEASKRAVIATAEQTGKLVRPGQCIMTHSYSSTVNQVFRQLAELEISAIITESQPGCEGAQLARELSGLGVETRYITDAQAGLFVKDADIVLVGADTLLADGSVVNKAGTYLLALAANDHQIPFYACCESFKQSDLNLHQVELEAMDTDEITLENLPHLQKQNLYFDITPARLVSGWVNEKGVYSYD